MKNSKLEKDKKIKKIEENIIKDVKNIFRLNNLFRLKKENKATKERIIWDIRNLFDYEEDNICKFKACVCYFLSNFYFFTKW